MPRVARPTALRRPLCNSLRGLVPIVLVAASACGGEAPSAEGWVAETDTIADTIRVQTRSGSVWQQPRVLVEEASIGVLDGAEEYMLGAVSALAVGADDRVYITDGQAMTLRMYDAQGDFVRTLATEGGGPGEVAGPDGGLMVLADGRVAIRDPGNSRISVFDPDSGEADSWRLPTGLQTSENMYLAPGGELWSSTVLNLGVPLSEWEWGFLRYTPDGDSLPAAPLGVPVYEEDVVVASVEGGGTSQQMVPFAPRQNVRINAAGERVNAVPTRYAFDIHRRDGSVLRIGRDAPPVAVGGAESDARRRRVERSLRTRVPDWRWNGPPIPDVKAPYVDLYVGDDGRYWVLTAQPGVETDEPMWEPGPGEPAAPNAWEEPVVFDVFEADGRYLGSVHAPDGFQIYPRPVFRGDRIWAVIEDDLGVERVVRFRMEAEAGDS